MVQAIVAGIKSKVITKKKNAKLFILKLALTMYMAQCSPPEGDKQLSAVFQIYKIS